MIEKYKSREEELSPLKTMILDSQDLPIHQKSLSKGKSLVRGTNPDQS
jgi:hypothetical protein